MISLSPSADCVGDPALWSEDDPSGQVLLSQTRYCSLLERNRPDLMRLVDPDFLWPHLRALTVIDEMKEAELKVSSHCHIKINIIRPIDRYRKLVHDAKC